MLLRVLNSGSPSVSGLASYLVKLVEMLSKQRQPLETVWGGMIITNQSTVFLPWVRQFWAETSFRRRVAARTRSFMFSMPINDYGRRKIEISHKRLLLEEMIFLASMMAYPSFGCNILFTDNTIDCVIIMSEDRLKRSKVALTLGDFEVERVLGEGAFGFVLLASRNREEVALKEMSKHRLRKVHSEHVALVEKELARSLKHPGVVSGTSAFQTSSKLYLVLQYCGGGEFQQLAVRGMREESRRFYFAELVSTVQYLQKAGIVHRDIKPANLLLTHEGHLKMIDFGTACLDQCTLVPPAFLEAIEGMKLEREGSQDLPGPTPLIRKRKSTFVGTSQYMPPELIMENSCGLASDLWAMGCILYFLYYGQCPFEDPCELVVFQKIKGGKFSFPENEEISPEAKDLVSRLLLTNPLERLGSGYREDLSFKSLKEHPFFDGLDIDNIFSLQPPHFISPETEVCHKLSKLQDEEDHFVNNTLVLYLARKVHHIFIVFRCIFLEGLQMHQYEVQGLSQLPLRSSLNPNKGSEIAKCITTKKLLIRALSEQGSEEKLFFWAHSADDCAKKINNFYSKNLRETDLQES